MSVHGTKRTCRSAAPIERTCLGRAPRSVEDPGAVIRFRRPAILFARVRSNQGSQCTIDLIKKFIGLENTQCLRPETTVAKIMPGRRCGLHSKIGRASCRERV